MNKIVCVFLLLCSSSTMAGLLTEDFEDAFPIWENNWLGVNTNLQNYYGVGAGHGNNPDGLWIADGLNNGGNVTEINFDSIFGSTITSFELDISSYSNGLQFMAFDMSGVNFFNSAITNLSGATTDPGTYQTISFSTLNGLSSFSISGGSVEGWVSIDNVAANTGVSVLEPSSMLLLGLGIAGLGFTRKRKQ